jgi:hypothetical protein
LEFDFSLKQTVNLGMWVFSSVNVLEELCRFGFGDSTDVFIHVASYIALVLHAGVLPSLMVILACFL